MLQNLATLEESILLGIQSNLRNEWLTPVFIFITRTLEMAVLYGSLVPSCFLRQRKPERSG